MIRTYEVCENDYGLGVPLHDILLKLQKKGYKIKDIKYQVTLFGTVHSRALIIYEDNEKVKVEQ